MLVMRRGFGLNTDLFETNVLNLFLVLAILLTFVSDAFRSLLDQRRQAILLTIREADEKAADARKRLRDVQEAVARARLRAKEICAQALQTSMQEKLALQKQSEEALYRLRERVLQSIRSERQKTIQWITQEVVAVSLSSAEDILLAAFVTQGSATSKQNELNEVHVRETLRKLERAAR
jgi:F-type H+-transporting ATPase subunit b